MRRPDTARGATPGLLLILLAAVLGACAGGPPPAEVPTRTAEGLDDGAVEALGRILRFEDHRSWDEAAFRRLAAPDQPEEVRRRAALAAGRIGDPSAADFLVDVLERDRSPGVRADAAFALGHLGVASPRVLDALIAAAPSGWVPVRDAEAPVAAELIAAIAKLDADRARRTVIDVLRELHPARTDRVARVVAAALLGSWRSPEVPGRVLAVNRFLDSDDAELRWRAAWALSRAGDAAGVPYLLPHAGDRDHRVRAYVARSLTAARADSALVADSALTVLGRLLDDRHPHVRINAIRALATYQDRADAAPIARLLGDDDPQVVIAAIGALPAVAGDEASRFLRPLVPDERRRLGVRGAALAELARLDAADTLVQAWASSTDWRSYYAARALANRPLDAALPLLTELAARPDRRIQAAALTAVAEALADTLEDAGALTRGRELLLEYADDPDPAVAGVVREAFPGSTDGAADREGAAADAVASDDPAFYTGIARTMILEPLRTGERPVARIETPHGPVRVELLADEAPLTVHNFLRLARSGYYDDGVWHRVIPNFVLQDGAPAGAPDGGPGWTIRDEINRVRYVRGVMGMALSGPDTGGSQWFITHSPQPHLDGGYTVFGRVLDGMDAADSVLQGDRLPAIRIEP